MGFLDRFSKSFLGNKEDDGSTSTRNVPGSTLSLFAPYQHPTKPDVSAEMGSAGVQTAVAVAEHPQKGGDDVFDVDLDQELDSAFASLVTQESNAAAPASEMAAGDQAIVEDLFADIAANYARPIKNFIFEVKRGTATKDWLEICRPAIQGIMRAAEAMGLHMAAQRMVDFEHALSLARVGDQRTIRGELRNLLLWCYDDLVSAMPKAFVIGEEEHQREGIIINSLLRQIPDVGTVTVEKLYRAGLTSLETLYLAKKDELAVATGIPVELSETICLKFKAYRAGLQGSIRDVAEGQRRRLSEMVSELRRHHEGFVHASENEWANHLLAAQKREFRQQRQTCLLWITVLLAEIGELELVNELQKMSFERRIQRLGEYLATPTASA